MKDSTKNKKSKRCEYWTEVVETLVSKYKDLDKAVLRSFSMKANSSDEEILDDLFKTFISLQNETLL